MQFVKDGPDIPDALLHQHEDGAVIFFCGAGISYPARLPSFQDLVKNIYTELHSTLEPIEKEAFDNKRYDATIDLLEHRIPGGRWAVRSALARVLRPNLRVSGATATHKALLSLARDRAASSRLVTTNFDRIFESVMRDRSRRIPTFGAPLLPIPKDSRWHGLVYLHGLLPKTPTEKELNKLIVSSGDFGLAYLSERWAARFVSELFRNYIVCFVGYSIDDPVLRYMMDALAADRMLGESTLSAYAFAPFEASRRQEIENVWLAKRVTPILYEVPRGTADHRTLHRTLKEWADVHRDGVNAKEQIVLRHALTRPSASTVQDDFAGRVIWALSDSRGLPAKRFSEIDPPAPIEWLDEMWKPRFRHPDLIRFLVSPTKTPDDKLQFALVHRPSPYGLSPWMSLLTSDPNSSRWDSVMFHLARWLVHHLSDPSLIIWVALRGGTVHPNFLALIREALNKSATPPAVVTLWGLVLANRVRGRRVFPDLYQWFRDLRMRGQLTPSLRFSLRALLNPQVTLSKPLRMHDDTHEDTEGTPTIGEMVRWEIVLATDHVHYVLRDSKADSIWRAAIPMLLGDFTDLLRDAFGLMRELGGATDLSDFSYIHHPSIAEHPQNQYFQEWTPLVELLRDSWLAVASTDSRAAYIETQRWQKYRYPIFRRLALFAAGLESIFSPQQSLSCLLADHYWWLWSSETQRETLQLLGRVVSRIAPDDLAVLEQAILEGPPREMFRDEITAEQWQNVVENSVWLRLAKWRDSGVPLLPAGQVRLQGLIDRRSDRVRAVDDQSEFAYWMGSGSDWREFVRLPVSYRELPDWLREHPNVPFPQRDNWSERCKATFRQAAWALLRLAKDGIWPTHRWRDALQAWSDDQLRARSWRWVGVALAGAPGDFILDTAHSLIWWMRPMADAEIANEEIWLNIIGRVLALHRNQIQASDKDPVGKAINHPVGQGTEAILHFWYRQELEDKQGLPNRISELLTLICNLDISAYRHGRVILAQAVITLFRVDPAWTARNVLPLFSWTAAHDEARLAWEGFLWTPRIYFPFLASIKTDFLSTAEHYRELDKHSEQYAAFLTFTALEPAGTFSRSELAAAILKLPTDGLVRSARALLSALQSSGEKAPEYWQNRILPYINDIWPKSVSLRTDAISSSFAQLCIAARSAFPDALGNLKGWLQLLARPDYIVTVLMESNLCGTFPEATLEFLDAIVGDTAEWAPHDLPKCLSQIGAADPRLTQDTRYQRLKNYARQHNLAP
jgi:hypothetical protein